LQAKHATVILSEAKNLSQKHTQMLHLRLSMTKYMAFCMKQKLILSKIVD